MLSLWKEMTDLSGNTEIKDAIAGVEEKICAACKKAGRDRKEVTLIAVSKTKPVEAILEAVEAGLTEFGENKPQELRDKQQEISIPLHWHMIGSLQSNKLKYVVGKTVLIHSVDSLPLAREIDLFSEKKGVISSILLEMNLAKEPSKHGFSEEEIFGIVMELSRLSHIHIEGLMTVAPYTENPEENRVLFRKMRELMIDINQKNIDNIHMDKLSMGMTGDYEAAILEGATHIRVGTGIFGHRIYPEKD